MEVSGWQSETLKPLKLFWDSLLESAKLLTLVTSSQCLWASNNGHLDCRSVKIVSPVASYLAFFISFNSLLIRLSKKALLLLGGINLSTSSSSDLSIVAWIVLR